MIPPPAELFAADFWSLFTDELATQVILTTAEINAGKAPLSDDS